MATIYELAELSDAVYGGNIFFSSWTLIDQSDPNINGYFGQAYKNAAGEIVIANRGTRGPLDAIKDKDYFNDVKLTAGIRTAAQNDAVTFALKVANNNQGATIIETGHSLGGNNAQAGTAALQDLGFTVSAVTFNAPGIGGYPHRESSDKYNVLNISTQGDVIHLAGGEHLGRSIIISAGPDGLSQPIIDFGSALKGLLYLGLKFGVALYDSLIPGHSLTTITNYLTKTGEGGALGSVTWPTSSLPQVASSAGIVASHENGEYSLIDKDGNSIVFALDNKGDISSLNYERNGGITANFDLVGGTGSYKVIEGDYVVETTIDPDKIVRISTNQDGLVTTNTVTAHISETIVDYGDGRKITTTQYDDGHYTVYEPHYVADTVGGAYSREIVGDKNQWVQTITSLNSSSGVSIATHTKEAIEYKYIGASEFLYHYNADGTAYYSDKDGSMPLYDGWKGQYSWGDGPFYYDLDGSVQKVTDNRGRLLGEFDFLGNKKVFLDDWGSYNLYSVNTDALVFQSRTFPNGDHHERTYGLGGRLLSHYWTNSDGSYGELFGEPGDVLFADSAESPFSGTVYGVDGSYYKLSEANSGYVKADYYYNDQLVKSESFSNVSSEIFVSISFLNPQDWFLLGTDADDVIVGTEGEDNIFAGKGNDLINGGESNDLLAGGAGNDNLDGGTGNDIYLYARGDGSDNILTAEGSGMDTLRFNSTIQAGDITLTRSQYDLYVSPGADYDVLTLLNWFGSDGNGDGAERVTKIEFADGMVWDVPAIINQLSVPTAGNDYLTGSEGDDVLIGLAGDDVLNGMGGNDTLDAGTGTNLVSGGEGNDVYRYSGGVLTINDWSVAIGEQDRLAISGVSPDSLVLRNSAGNLDIADSDGNLIIRIVAYFKITGNGELKSGDIVFADGTVWNRSAVAGMVPMPIATEDHDELWLTASGVIDGLGGGDHIVGLSNSTLNGGDGNDYLEIAGVGNDAILHGDDGNDRLQMASGARDLLYGDAGDDGLLVLNGSGMMMDGGAGIDYLQLSDGDNSTLRGGADRDTILIQHGSKNWLYGDAGDDSLQVRNSSETMMDGGTGADYLSLDDGDNNTLRGGAERDELQSQYGDNNWLYGDSGDDTLRFERGGQSNHGYGGDGNDTLMGADGNGAALYGDDGNDVLQWDRGSAHLLDGGAGNDTLRGFSDNATLLGGDGLDTMQANNTGAWMDGGAGNDLINIYAGNSTLIGGEGDDTLDGSNNYLVMRGGAGKDKLSTSGNFNLLDGGADDDSVNVGGGSDLTMLGGEGNDTLTLGAGARNLLDGGDGDDVLQVGAYQANVVRGGAGADTIGVNYGSAQIEGGSGNDTIKTGATNQFVAGGAGDDLITVQNGADIVAFNLGDGKDTIDGTGVTATLSLGEGVEYANLLFSRDQTDLILKVGGTDQLRLKDWYNADELHRTVSQLQFILDGGTDYDAASTDVLRNQRTTLFDFQQLVDTFDSAQLADPTLTAWSVTSALLSAHLGGGNTDAIGGELAYQYGRSGNLDALTMPASVALLAAPEFGASRQQFQPLTS